jgi:2-polyprenyl-3-methyl-5-hydroxy-6-metoxy-1,4-benzoquinol methylase
VLETQAKLRIGILVVAYNAETTLQATLDRIPAGFRSKIHEILIFDDASVDATVAEGLAWRDGNPSVPTTVVRHHLNLGYGGNQKAGYREAIERGLDIVVLLHGDGQYAPEALPQLVAPLERGEADAVFGSRMMVPGGARAGGMPLYKLAGNKILSAAENKLLGSSLSEFHSGYRAYRVSALAELPLRHCTDEFDFDTQIIIQLMHAGKRIAEIPIPTYYGEEICRVDGLKYAKDVIGDVLRYRLAKLGFGTAPWIPADPEYDLKDSQGTSHTAIAAMLAARPPARILDLGCSGGRLAERLRRHGHHVTGVDSLEIDGVRDRVDDFHLADLEHGLPPEAGAGYDLVIAADVIEHLRDPAQLLRQMTQALAPDGQLIVSTPNFAHWYPRARVLAGAFDYDRRGILDQTHLRFFTRASLRRLFKANGLDLLELSYTGLPLAILSHDRQNRATRLTATLDRTLLRLRPTLFSYQFIARLRPHHTGSTTHP